MTYKFEIGKFGENIACKYLVNKAYEIIERNPREKWGELDIIAKAPDKTLIFVEVKTMSKNQKTGLKPEDQLTAAKLKKLKRTAYLYANHHQELIKDDKGWRIDLIALTIKEKSCIVRHYKNVI